MKNLKKNPFFYLSLVLGLAVVLEAAGIVNAAWTAPTQNPPLGNPAQPIDTSGATQIKTGNLVIANPNGVKFGASSPVIFFGQFDSSGTLVTSQKSGAIQYLNGQLQYTSNYGVDAFQPIGSGSIGSWPISIPTSGPQGTNGFFGFQLANTGWTGFDLSGNAANRLILGVSNAQVSNASNIFDVEAPGNNWQHTLELRADGSAMFKGSVVASGFSDSSGPVPPNGSWCGLSQNIGGKNYDEVPCAGVYPSASCPAGWTQVVYPGNLSTPSETIMNAICVKTGAPSGGTGSGGTGGGGSGGIHPYAK